MERDEEAIRKAYIQGGIDALNLWWEYYELGQKTAKQLYKWKPEKWCQDEGLVNGQQETEAIFSTAWLAGSHLSTSRAPKELSKW